VQEADDVLSEHLRLHCEIVESHLQTAMLRHPTLLACVEQADVQTPRLLSNVQRGSALQAFWFVLYVCKQVIKHCCDVPLYSHMYLSCEH